MNHRIFTGNCLRIIPSVEKPHCVIADPPYDDVSLINESIFICRSVCQGASFFFMYADNIFDLKERPDQVLFWAKPISTKNTIRKYSRFVEVICCYDLERSPFRQDTHWSARSGIFTDSLIGSLIHPFQKPVSLMEKILAVNAVPGDLILDPFAGSETVRIASEKLGMNSISIELKPRI